MAFAYLHFTSTVLFNVFTSFISALEASVIKALHCILLGVFPEPSGKPSIPALPTT